MIGYTMLGTNDIAASAEFYDKVLEPLGAKRTWEEEEFIMWSVGEMSEGTSFGITKPYDGGVANFGNGTMIALAASSTELVDQVHAAAIAAGGSDEGAPGYRGDPSFGFYAGYFRDALGNKLNAFCMAPQKAD